jgi:hypothetical protein
MDRGVILGTLKRGVKKHPEFLRVKNAQNPIKSVLSRQGSIEPRKDKIGIGSMA